MFFQPKSFRIWKACERAGWPIQRSNIQVMVLLLRKALPTACSGGLEGAVWLDMSVRVYWVWIFSWISAVNIVLVVLNLNEKSRIKIFSYRIPWKWGILVNLFNIIVIFWQSIPTSYNVGLLWHAHGWWSDPLKS